ncbi:MAG: hypothetical protein K8R53_09320, partial [Bacteroidales bacterium]|nr:hypothetical protein [Bacteroidales bacterium]
MRKTMAFFALLTILATVTLAQKKWIPFTDQNPQLPQIEILEQGVNKLVLEITVPGLFITESEEQGEIYQRLELIAFNTTKEVGRPELPMINQLIGIPDNKLISVNILEKKTEKIENILVYPFQTPTTDNPGGGPKEFVIDEEFYKANKPYPERQVYVNNTGVWRDVKVAGLHIVPCKYNPSTNEMEVITSMKVEITFDGFDGRFIMNRSKQVSPAFFRMYESSIVNFQSMGYSMNMKGNDDIKYLIITNTNALSSIQPFVDWKNQQGFKVEVKTLTSGFNTPPEFKNYINQLYNSDNLEYVFMVGDAYPNGGNNGGPDDVPMYWWAPSGETGSYSDSWYTCLGGPDDHYADLAVGRLTYDNLGELDLQVQKTLDHYFNPDVNSNWAEN